jgi:glycosyltransferase involved in cell wall biosynthesis
VIRGRRRLWTPLAKVAAGKEDGLMKISAVIPVYNEAESLLRLHEELSTVAKDHDYELEIIFVDDGSDDGTWEQVESLAASDAGVQGIRFRRNFGKAAALRAGFEVAEGEVVFTLDGDLQDDPAEMPRFLEALEEGFDVVSGWKKVRHDPWHKVGPSRIFNWMVSRVTGVRLHDHNCGFKAYRRPLLSEIRLYGEMHRFIPVLAAAKGWKVGEVVVNHRKREFGKSKYGVLRMVKGFLDLLTVSFLTGFGQRPQHLLGTLGLVAFAAGGIGLSVLTGCWVVTRTVDGYELLHLHERAVFYFSIVSLLLGAQFMSVGILAEMMAAQRSRDEGFYSIAQRTGTAEDDPEA